MSKHNKQPKFIVLTIPGYRFPNEPNQTFPLCRYGKRGYAAPTVPGREKKISEASEITLVPPKKRFKNSRKKLKKYMHNGKCDEVLHAIRQLPECFENGTAAAQLVLLSTLSWIGSQLVGTLTLPLVQLSNATPQTFSYVDMLLSLFHGPQQWKGGNYKLKRPTLLKAKQSALFTAPSQDAGEYIGGHYDDYGKKRTFWLPYFNQAVAFDPSLPGSVAQSILSVSPFALFITDTRCKAPDGRPVLKIDASNLDSVDLEKLHDLQETLKHLRLMLAYYFSTFFEHPKRHCLELIERVQGFRPIERRGAFTKAKTTPQTDAICYALALFSMMLEFYAASDEQAAYPSVEETEDILLHYWRLALPDSAPKEDAPTDGSMNYYDPPVFYQALKAYLTTYKDQILWNGKGNAATMALVKPLEKREDSPKYLIIPCEKFLEFYQSRLPDHTCCNADLSDDAAVQRKLMDAGIPLKAEKAQSDKEKSKPVWRHKFYENGTDSDTGSSTIKCLGLLMDDLPDEIQSILKDGVSK